MRVALIDGDVLSGTSGVLCDIAANHNLSDLLPHLRDLEADLVENMMSAHPSGVRELPAPDQLQRAETIGGDDMQRTLSGLRPYFDYQVVDTASRAEDSASRVGGRHCARCVRPFERD